MKINVSREAILGGLQKVQSIVSPKSTLPIIANVHLHAEDGQLILTATDLEVTVRTSIEAEVEKEGGTTLPAKRLYSVFREMTGSSLEIDVNSDNIASVTCDASFFKLHGLPEKDFPPLPSMDGGSTFTIAQRTLRDMLKRVVYAASTDESRYVLNGALLSFKDEKLTVVATDGRRLALIEEEVEFPAEAEHDLIVPTKTSYELIRSLQDEGEVEIICTEKQIAFKYQNVLIISKLIEGVFPNFRQVIPASSEYRIPIERETLFQAVKRAALITVEQSKAVKLVFGQNRLELITETPQIGEAREKIPVKYSGPEIAASFNPEFVMDPLKVLDCDEIFFEITDGTSPGVIKADVPFLYVLMPMRLH